MLAISLCWLLLTNVAFAQNVGTHVQEQHPVMPVSTCSSSGCTKETKSVVIDSNWRWVHDSGYTNCYKGSSWDPTLCPDPVTCSKNCYVEGAGTPEYLNTYGVQAIPDGIKLGFVTETQYGANYGSRLYMLEDENSYKIFKLKNREFTFTVDTSSLPCGLNGAVYFVEMNADGGIAKSGGLNKAGAGYGTGYCDAQCPHDLKFINGGANVLNWNATADPPVGHYGSCCAEMDIWEANSRSTAYTAHSCSKEGPYRCEGKECGDTSQNQRFDGVCDKDGCDFNSFRLGNKTFYGLQTEFTVDSTKPVTVVTQFITADGTDEGDLVEIRRFYAQNGQVIPNSESRIKGVSGNSITDPFCSAMKETFGDINDFARKGGLKAMGEALDRGMVLVFSLWDDSQANMLWLDSQYPLDKPVSTPGVLRGPCETTTGSTQYVRSHYPHSSVTYSDVRVGQLNTTLGSDASGDSSGSSSNPSGSGSSSDDPYGGDRRLRDSLYV